MQPPLSVIQHTQAPRKFVLISSHGTQIVSKLRPVDHLRQLLIDNGGPDNDVIKAFFGLHNETQAAATCLVLATSQAIKDTQVAEWATRAFFLYGGEARLLYSQQQQQQQQQVLGGNRMQTTAPATATSFMPHIASTPAPGGRGPDFSRLPFSPMSPSVGSASMMVGGQQQPTGVAGAASQLGPNPHIMAPTEVYFSAKHNGLYLYFSRLVRPIWLATLIVPGLSLIHI